MKKRKKASPKKLSPNAKAFLKAYLRTRAPMFAVLGVILGALSGGTYWALSAHPSWGNALALRIKYGIKVGASQKPSASDVATRDEIERLWQDEFSLHSNIALTLGFLVSAGVFGGSMAFLQRRMLERMEPRFLRGVRIVTPEEQAKEIEAKVKSGGNVKYTPSDLVIGAEKIRVPVGLGNSFWGLIGDSGTGKSSFIKNALLQIRSHGEKTFIFDPNGEFYSQFGRPGDHILSLYDDRAEFFDFWVDGFENMTIASSLVEERGDGGGSSGFWSKAGQLLFAGLLHKCRSQQELWDMLQMPWAEIKAILLAEGHISQRLLDEAKMASSILGTAAVDLYFLGYLNYWATQQGRTNPFSIRKWVGDNTDKSWVFVTVMDGHKAASRELVRMWFDLCINALFERGESKANTPVHVICDEFETLGNCPSLVTLLSRGRKYDGSLTLGMQARSQLDASFKKMAPTVLQGLQDKLFLRSTDPEMAEYASRALGEQEVEETNYVTAISKDGESVSTSTHVGKRRVVLPDEVQMLPDMEGYLWLAQEINPAPITLEFIKLPAINPHGSVHNKVPPNFIQCLSPEWEAKHAALVAAAKRKAEVAALKERVEGLKLEEAELEIEEKRRVRNSGGSPTVTAPKQVVTAGTSSGLASPAQVASQVKRPVSDQKRIDSPEESEEKAPAAKVKDEPKTSTPPPVRRIERI